MSARPSPVQPTGSWPELSRVSWALSLGPVVDRYPDGDVAVQLLESVRRKDVFLIQPTSPPANDHLLELLDSAALAPRALTAFLRLRTGGQAA